MREVQATTAPGVDASQANAQTIEEQVDVVQVAHPCRPQAPHLLWLLVDVVGGDDEDVVGAHVRLRGVGTGVDAGKLLAPVGRSGSVATRSR